MGKSTNPSSRPSRRLSSCYMYLFRPGSFICPIVSLETNESWKSTTITTLPFGPPLNGWSKKGNTYFRNSVYEIIDKIIDEYKNIQRYISSKNRKQYFLSELHSMIPCLQGFCIDRISTVTPLTWWKIHSLSPLTHTVSIFPEHHGRVP